MDMKRIMSLVAVAALCCGPLAAQRETRVAEKDVDVNYVQDFQRQAAGAKDVAWWKSGEDAFKATYLDAENSRQAMVFSPRGSETHYFVDLRYCPAAVRDTAARLFPAYKLEKVWVRKMRGKMTYQARVVKRSGFLWWRKEVDAKVLNFEVDGRYINID